MKPTKKQIKEAFRETIERWGKIVNNLSYYEESYCSLCTLENVPGDICMSCNHSCPIRNYKDENHYCCVKTPYGNFYHNRTPENALVELNFLREVYIDFLEKNGMNKEKAEEAKCCKEEEWEDVTRELTAEVCMIEPRGYIVLSHDGIKIAYTKSHYKDEGLRFSLRHNDYKIETKGGDFNILRKKE